MNGKLKRKKHFKGQNNKKKQAQNPYQKQVARAQNPDTTKNNVAIIKQGSTNIQQSTGAMKGQKTILSTQEGTGGKEDCQEKHVGLINGDPKRDRIPFFF